MHPITLRGVPLLVLTCAIGSLLPATAQPAPAATEVGFHPIGDGTTLNTLVIQSAIDKIAKDGGGTLTIPKGVFLTGSLFLKPGVNLHLDKGAVLKGSTDRKDYPVMRTRVEGHFENWLPALINADQTDHLRITGSGTLDGNGAPFWNAFWDARKEDSKTTNLSVPRPRLALIQNSKDVEISGITFKDSGFWNLHLYRCEDVLVENVRFQIPEGVKCPSTDGTDIDSSRNVTIRNCTYRVDDDCIALKGSKGPLAMDDKDSPPVENIRVTGCTFERGHGVVTLGSEATLVRDVIVEDCKVVGPINLVRFKLRPDTPQRYEDIHYRNITLDSDGGVLVQARPWKQYFDLMGHQPPQSIVRNITLSNITGRHGSLGEIAGNPGQTTISDITFTDINLKLNDRKFTARDVKGLKMTDVTVNGESFTVKADE
jgi:polygalacturonase